jgi:hypothetical protein
MTYGELSSRPRYLVERGLVGKQLPPRIKSGAGFFRIMLLLRAVARFACESERRIAWMALFIER